MTAHSLRMTSDQPQSHLWFNQIRGREVQFQPPVNTAEDNLAFQSRLLAFGYHTQPMTSDQQFIGSAFSKHVRTQHGVRYDNGVQPVHSDSLDRMQVFQRLAVFIDECHVPANISD